MTKPTSSHSGQTRPSSLSRLMALAFQQRLLIWASIVLSIFSVILGLAPAFILAEIAELLEIPLQPGAAIWELVLIGFGLFVVRWLSLAASVILSHIAAFSTLYDLRIHVVEKLGRVPLGQITKRNSGSIKKIIQSDVERIELFIAHLLPDFAAAVALPVVSAIILFWLDWRLGLASISTLPLAVGFQAIMMRTMGERQKQQALAHERMNGALVQFIQGINVIKSFNLTSARFGQLHEAISSFRIFANAVSATLLPFWALFQVGVKANLLVTLAIGGWLSLTGELSKPDLLLALMMSFGLVSPMMRILFMSGNLKQIETGLDRIDEILEAPEQPHHIKAIELSHHCVDFQSVSFAYEEKPILKDLTVSLPQGSRTAIVGRSGSGKSTIVNLLARFWDVDEGQIRIGDLDIRDFPQQDLHRTVSFVFQDSFLFDDSVLANIQCARPEATSEQILDACKKAQAHDFIMDLPNGYDTILGEKGGRLSGGERQRLSIARLILRDAPIIVLDEATAFADQLNARAISKALEAASKGKSVLTIAHRLDTIINADQIIFLQEGLAARTGTHDELLRECVAYADLWAAYQNMDGWKCEAAAEDQKEMAS